MPIRLLAFTMMPFIVLVYSGCSECKPDCNDRCCGDDGCGGECPDICGDFCDTGLLCDRVHCRCHLADCEPNCFGKCCGYDECCGTCVTECPGGWHCNQDSCYCEQDACSSDTDCAGNTCCFEGLCSFPDCNNLECGPDAVCGKECGTCTDGHRCDEFGKCVVGGPSSWAKSAGGISDDSGASIASLDDGSSFVTGHFYGTATFGPGEVNETALTTSTNREHYMFVARYDPYGKLIWAKCAGDWATSTRSSGVLTSIGGSSVVTGSFLGKTATFGLGEENETILTYDYHNTYLFVARYNPDGTLTWARSAGGDGQCSSTSMDAFSDGSFLVAGSFYGTATFGLGEMNETLLDAPKDENGFLRDDIFIARFGTDGTLAWARQDGGLDTNAGASSISLVSDGAFLVAGGFSGTAVFGLGETNETTMTADYQTSDMFIAQYLHNGEFNWTVRAGGEKPISVSDISAFADGTFIVVGSFEMNAVFGMGEANETELVSEGGWDMFIASYNQDGTLSWAKREGGSDYETASSVSVNEDGSFVIGGQFLGSIVFGKGEVNETALTSTGCTDSFIARYLPDGTLEWVVSQGGPVDCDEFIPHGEHTTDVLWLSDGSIMATGYFDESATFFTGESYETTLNSAGWWDIFIMKIGP